MPSPSKMSDYYVGLVRSLRLRKPTCPDDPRIQSIRAEMRSCLKYVRVYTSTAIVYYPKLMHCRSGRFALCFCHFASYRDGSRSTGRSCAADGQLLGTECSRFFPRLTVLHIPF